MSADGDVRARIGRKNWLTISLGREEGLGFFYSVHYYVKKGALIHSTTHASC